MRWGQRGWYPVDLDEGALWLQWLVWLRWLAILAQTVTFIVVRPILDSASVISPWLGVSGGLIVANIFALKALRSSKEISHRLLLGHLLLDVAALTVFFVLGGGPDNSFTVLYFIHVAMGAVILPRWSAAFLAAFVMACYALLHIVHLPLHFERHLFPPDVLVSIGQLFAFGITGTSLVIFVSGLSIGFRERKEMLLAAQARTARTDRLRSVGTLAAGAAHELNTPLSTIDLRIRRILRRDDTTETVTDLNVMQEQLERCKRVVNQLLIGAGNPSASEMEQRALGALVEEGVSLWCKGSTLGVKVEDSSDGLEVALPRVAFVQALINLLENARHAQEEAGCLEPITLRILEDHQIGVVQVLDRGIGLPVQLEQVGEPFFTTKQAGTGLGVFVARAVADGAGGGLSFSRRNEGGTSVRWWFPAAGSA